jgi:hypothetical protein
MLIIRREQTDVLKQAARRNFEDRTTDHLKVFAPAHFKILGNARVRQVIQLGVDRAGSYSLFNREPVSLYIELMLMLGSDFDTDPQLPWVRKILTDETVSDQSERAGKLYDETIRFAGAVSGPNHEYERDALRRVCHKRLEDFPVADQHSILSHLRSVHPQKCEYVGEVGLRLLIQRGIGKASEYGVTAHSGVLLFVGLMFAFGHGCFTDPQFPWVAATLDSRDGDDRRRQVERLYAKTMTYLGFALSDIEQR